MDLFYSNCYNIINPFLYGKSYKINHRFGCPFGAPSDLIIVDTIPAMVILQVT